MRLPGKKRLVLANRWLRSRFTTAGLILGYHRVSDVTDDFYSICVRPEHFAEQMAVLRREANPISLDEMIEGLKIGSLPPRAVAVTFDDGYADNLYQAKPVLEEHEIPATLFVASGYLGRRFWWDELAYLLRDSETLPQEISVEAAGKTFQWRLPDADKESGHLLLEETYRDMLGFTAEQQEQALQQLRQLIVPAHKQSNCNGRALTPDELQDFSSNGLVTIGSHSVSHPLLASLSRESQRQEIEWSKRDLEALLGKSVNSFSYPNGSYDKTTRSLVQDAGYAYACASHNDVSSVKTDRFNLPRFWIPDQNGSQFSGWLRRWAPN
jgi:peptidoglycan/xylan/chitin deacetylase (PgdA/CDA1 family)